MVKPYRVAVPWDDDACEWSRIKEPSGKDRWELTAEMRKRAGSRFDSGTAIDHGKRY